MKYLFSLLFPAILLSAIAYNASAQDTKRDAPPKHIALQADAGPENEAIPDTKIYTFVSQMPESAYDMKSYLQKNIQMPDSVLYHGKVGNVVVQFVVNEDGSISGAKVVKGIGAGCDEEALRLISKMPPWAPGKDNGQVVKVSLMQRIPFDNSDKIYIYVEQMPMAKGFDMYKYLAANIRYPDEAKKKNIQGRVIVQFIVMEDGSLADVKVVKGIGYGCDEEAVRVVQSMPEWAPGKQEGRTVKVNFQLPISFHL